jgi:hypothetical protein
VLDAKTDRQSVTTYTVSGLNSSEGVTSVFRRGVRELFLDVTRHSSIFT